MLKFKLTFSFLLLFSLCAVSQKLQLGKVTDDELLEARNKTDTSAPAAFIFKTAKTEFIYTEDDGFTSTTVFQIKLKIYKKEGLEWANFKIPYYVGYTKLDDEIVEVLNGYTYNLEKGKIVKTRVTGEGKFNEKVNENWKIKSVVFPNVREGSILELEYKFKSQNLSVLPDFQFQYDIPVDNAEFKTAIPKCYDYSGMKKGFAKVE